MSSERARVLLVGRGCTAGTALASLVAAHDVLGLVREASADDLVVKQAREEGVPVFGTASLAVLTDVVHELAPDCVVVSSFDRLLPASLLRACHFVNVHYSPLPRHRGRANVNWAVINGDREAAISIHEMLPDLDAGGLLFQQRVPIGPRTTAAVLYLILNTIQERELGAAVSRLLSGQASEQQDVTQATYDCTRVPEDGEMDWTAGSAVLDRLVRGLTAPAPGAFTFLGVQRLWVDRAEPAPRPVRYEGRVPGRVVNRSVVEGWVDVLTGDGVLRLHEVRLEDGPSIAAAAVLTSVKATLGLRSAALLGELVDLRRRLEASELANRLPR
jgi:methionyl-tRNA formyltransferase